VLKLLNEDRGDLHRLIAHAERLQRASQVLRTHLDEPLAGHCQVANIKDGSIVMHADSSAWAAKLRFHVASMLEQLNQAHGFGVLRAIRIKVSPLSEGLPTVPAEQLTLSERAATVLKSAAHATEDSELRVVLLRLAQRQRQDTRDNRKEKS
jgi:hypothetical protein